MKVFMSGIAGTGMSSLAGLFCARGDQVSGSDTAFYPPVGTILNNLPARLHRGFNAAQIPADVDLCVIGNIISRGNPEAEFILDHRLPYASMPQALYDHFIRGRSSIVVAGAHGKTTITAFIAFLLHHAGLDPGYFVGGKPIDFSTGFQIGGGDFFVSEGDEYETAFFDRSSKFLKYHPDILVLSACEYDHLDFFPTENAYESAFRNVINQVPSNGLIVSSMDFAMNREISTAAFTPLRGYGADAGDFRIMDVEEQGEEGFCFLLQSDTIRLPVQSPMAGSYNAWNLSAGILVGLHLGIPEEKILEAASAFHGVERRLRRIRTLGATRIYEDYAHHPTALGKMLASMRQRFPTDRLVCILEPRSWSMRRNDFQDRLTVSLAQADDVWIRRTSPGGKIPSEMRLDEDRLATELQDRGTDARVAEDEGEIQRWIRMQDMERPTVMVVASNGSFGGLPDWLKTFEIRELTGDV